MTYDDLIPARLPLPTGDHVPVDANAEVAVVDGELRVTIPRFTLSNDEFQAADSPKYLAFSDRQFDVPADRPVTFAVDMAVENIAADPADYRRGIAAFHVFDLEVTSRVFAVCGTSTRAVALHEQLPLGGGAAAEPFYHVVESPYADFGDDFTRLRECAVTLDRSASTAIWRVDGQKIYEANGTLIPERVSIGIGIWTMLPIRDGRSQANVGQGLSARWRGFRMSQMSRASI